MVRRLQKHIQRMPWLLLTCSFAGHPALAQESGPEVGTDSETKSRTSIESRIQELDSRADLADPQKDSIRVEFQQALSKLAAAEEQDRQQRAFQKSLELAPAETTRYKERLTELSQTQSTAPPPNAVILSAEELDHQLLEFSSKIAHLQSTLKETEESLRAQQDRPGLLLRDLDQARQVLSAAEEARKTESEELTIPIAKIARAALQDASIMEANSIIRCLEEEQLSYQTRLNLLTARHDVELKELTQANAEEATLRERLQKQRLTEATEVRRQAQLSLADTAGKHPLVRSLAETNDLYSLELAEVTESINSVAARGNDLDEERKGIEHDMSRALRQLEVAGLSDAFAAILLEQRRKLPRRGFEKKDHADRTARINDARVRSFEIGELVESLAEPDSTVADIIDDMDPPADTPEDLSILKSEVREKIIEQFQLVERLDAAYGSLIKELGLLAFASESYTLKVREYERLLDEHLLWILSSERLSGATFRDAGEALVWLSQSNRWIQAGGALIGIIRHRPVMTLLVLAVSVTLLVRRKFYVTELERVASRVEDAGTDHFGHTAKALLLTIWLTIPLPLLAFCIGWQFQKSAFEDNWIRALGFALFTMASLTVTPLFIRHCARPGGLGVSHLRWPADGTRLLHRNLGWILPLGAILVGLTAFCRWSRIDTYEDSLGRLSFIALMIVTSVFLHRVLHPRTGFVRETIKNNPDSLVTRFSTIWYSLSFGLPALLAVMAAFGYDYAAEALFRSMYISCVLVAGTLLLHDLVLRWFFIRARGLALERESAHRTETDAGENTFEGTVMPDEDEQELDVTVMTAQTQHLVRFLMGTAVFVALWFVWADVLPALEFLKTITLHGTVTLHEVLLAVVIATLTYVAAKNIPGLLEIAILQRTNLSVGSRYAISSFSQYAVVAVGFFVVFDLMGLKWSQFGWILAALSVGLGFGLQEIVANFVSGIILLFERPIRVGDIVTVSGVTGIVSRIRIRATTITDWDRKDFVVPNKEFITGQILNWTLSNPINRVVVAVGVAYGSDTEKASELLLEIAKNHPEVLDDPAPMVAFEQFGDSALNINLRAYLPNLDKRILTIHELHTEINKRFEKENIVIAFPQIDVHLHQPAE